MAMKKVEVRAAATSQSARPPNRLGTASFFSRLFFLWVNPLVAAGRSKALQDEDLPELPDFEKSEGLHARFDASWDAERRRKPDAPSFARTMLCALLPSYLPYCAIGVAESASFLIQALALGLLVTRLGEPLDELGADGANGTSGANATGAANTTGIANEAAARELFLLAAAVSACSILAAFSHQHFFLAGWRLGLRARSGAVSMIYAKALRLDLDSLAGASTGHSTPFCRAAPRGCALTCGRQGWPSLQAPPTAAPRSRRFRNRGRAQTRTPCSRRRRFRRRRPPSALQS